MMVDRRQLDALADELRADIEREVAGLINLIQELREEIAKKDDK